MNIKFDIFGSSVTAVLITEESVLGKEKPIYFTSDGEEFGTNKSVRSVDRRRSLHLPLEMSQSFTVPTKMTRQQSAPCSYSDFELGILEGMEL